MKTESRKKPYHYSWHHHNQLQLLVDGDVYYQHMLDSIASAQQQILLELYLFESGVITSLFIDALCEAHRRGVAVYLLIDEYGARGLNNFDRTRIEQENLYCVYYNPASLLHLARSLLRDHRKLLVIDQQLAYTGGAGVTDDFFPSVRKDYWHDCMIKIQGPVVHDCVNMFVQLWAQHNSQPVSEILSHTNDNAHSGDARARLLVAAGGNHNEIKRATLKHFKSAKKRIWLTSPYFVSSWNLRRHLRHAARRGIEIRLLFPGPFSDHPWISHAVRRFYRRMLRAGIRIHEYQPRFTHSKIVMVDDWVCIGSSNLDRWNQHWNLDANLEFYDKVCQQQVEKYFTEDFSHSQEIELQHWLRRSWVSRFKEWYSGFLVYWLERLIRRHRKPRL